MTFVKYVSNIASLNHPKINFVLMKLKMFVNGQARRYDGKYILFKHAKEGVDDASVRDRIKVYAVIFKKNKDGKRVIVRDVNEPNPLLEETSNVLYLNHNDGHILYSEWARLEKHLKLKNVVPSAAWDPPIVFDDKENIPPPEESSRVSRDDADGSASRVEEQREYGEQREARTGVQGEEDGSLIKDDFKKDDFKKDDLKQTSRQGMKAQESKILTRLPR